jgi:hypothetical protein
MVHSNETLKCNSAKTAPTLALTVCRHRHMVRVMSPRDKPRVWLHGKVKTPEYDDA